MATQYLNQVDQFKEILGYGARKNLWRMEVVFPGLLGLGDVQEKVSIMCEVANLPGQRKIETVDIKYKGESFALPVDKGLYPEAGEFKVMFKNAEDFQLRSAFEVWMQTIQQDFTALRTSPTIFKSSGAVIQLDHTLTEVRRFKFRGLFPTSVNPIELTAAEGGINDTTVEFKYDTFELVAVA